MAKLTKSFKGVPEGEIYPRAFEAGDDCPIELEAGAIACGALDAATPTGAPADKKPTKVKGA